MNFKKLTPGLLLLALAPFLGAANGDGCTTQTKEQQAQQQVSDEGFAQTGMPAIRNFRERRLLKSIFELRDQDNLATYTYLFSPMTGKFVKVCDSIGYGIPYATEYTNPQRVVPYAQLPDRGNLTIPQADPNGLYSPPAAAGTWVMCLDPKSKKAAPQYIEPDVLVTTYELATQ